MDEKLPKHSRVSPTKAELESLADRTALVRLEAIAIIEGLLPGPKIGSGGWTCFEENAESVRKLLDAVGRDGFPISPHELVKVCERNTIELPEEFFKRVQSNTFVLRRSARSCDYKDEKVHIRSRAGRKSSTSSSAVQGKEPAIMRMARDLVLKYVEWNRTLPSKSKVVKQIASKLQLSEQHVSRAFSIRTCLSRTDLDSARRRYRRVLREGAPSP